MRAVRGTRDLFASQCAAFDKVVSVARSVASLYCFEKIDLPIFEYAEVFTRSLGDLSDIVHKEIYTFRDKSDNLLALRPEFTAGVMRAFITNKLQHHLPKRYFTFGPLFRYDRPQAGRQRQFHQLNFEMLGLSSPFIDAELLAMVFQIFKDLNIDGVDLEINSLGCEESRKSYVAALYEHFSRYKADLSELSQLRLEKNVLRILDSKEECDLKLVDAAPGIDSYYTLESARYFQSVLSCLSDLGIEFIVNKTLVRGLDYYDHTIFECRSSKLGSQSAVFAGGRYNGLSKLMGGSDIPAIGCAGGIERLMMMMQESHTVEPHVAIVPIELSQLSYAMVLANNLRIARLPCLIYEVGKVATRIQKACNAGARYVVFLGESEVSTNSFKLKDLVSGVEIVLGYKDLINSIVYNENRQ